MVETSNYFPTNTCIHGLYVKVKKGTLKRTTQLVKHSRFLNNLRVYPVFPPEPEPEEEKPEGEGGDEENNDD